MVSYLKQYLKDDLAGAYVHGSLGTYDEIPYSDFDALVILKDEVFESKERLVRVAKKLNNAQKIMFDFDPLQHHGWFVLAESQLDDYPEHYFPVELFRYAKSLFPDKGLELKIRVNNSLNKQKESFNNLCNSIIERLNNKNHPKNMYQLKGLLSQFMLLPSLYVQVRDNKGIFKKFSFDETKKDFSEEEWSIMDEVSSIRKRWSYKISPIKRWLITKPNNLSRFLAKKFAPAIPIEIKKQLTDGFYQRIGNLVSAMKKRCQ